MSNNEDIDELVARYARRFTRICSEYAIASLDDFAADVFLLGSAKAEAELSSLRLQLEIAQGVIRMLQAEPAYLHRENQDE